MKNAKENVQFFLVSSASPGDDAVLVVVVAGISPWVHSRTDPDNVKVNLGNEPFLVENAPVRSDKHFF